MDVKKREWNVYNIAFNKDYHIHPLHFKAFLQIYLKDSSTPLKEHMKGIVKLCKNL